MEPYVYIFLGRLKYQQCVSFFAKGKMKCVSGAHIQAKDATSVFIKWLLVDMI